MSTSETTERLALNHLTPIGLSELDAKAQMLERLDNKYVVDARTMGDALTMLAAEFDVLEIDGRRSFTYETCYFDGPRLPCYFDHHQGRRVRVKVRMRAYAEADLCYVEVKLKDKRGITVKKRLRSETGRFGVLDQQAQAYVRQCYQSLYQKEFPYDLERVLDMRYRRSTLVARQGGERMTIDSGLQFFANGDVLNVDEHLFVVETKSANGNGLADRVLRTLHQHPTAHCSKYCLGTVLMNKDLKHNKFLGALRRLRGVAGSGEEAS